MQIKVIAHMCKRVQLHFQPIQIINIRNRKMKVSNAQFHVLNLMATNLSTHLPNSFALPRALFGPHYTVLLGPCGKRSGDCNLALFSIPSPNPEACSGIPVQVTR